MAEFCEELYKSMSHEVCEDLSSTEGKGASTLEGGSHPPSTTSRPGSHLVWTRFPSSYGKQLVKLESICCGCSVRRSGITRSVHWTRAERHSLRYSKEEKKRTKTRCSRRIALTPHKRIKSRT